MKSITVIATIPEFRPEAREVAGIGAARPDPSTAEPPMPDPAPRSRPIRSSGRGSRFPVRSVVALTVIAAGCWAAAGWSEWLRGQAAPSQPVERLARESSAVGAQHGTITP